MTRVYRDVTNPDGTITPGILTGDSRGTVRFFSPVMNTWGTLALVGGAIYSAWIFRRKGIMRNRVVGNWLIAAGGLLPALGGALIRLGDRRSSDWAIPHTNIWGRCWAQSSSFGVIGSQRMWWRKKIAN